MTEATEPFFQECYDPTELPHVLKANGKTLDQFQTDIVATVRAFCDQFKGRITGCVINTHLNTVGVFFGTEQYDFDLDDPITDQEVAIAQKGWDVHSLQGPATTVEGLEDFSVFSLETLHSDD